MRGVIKPLSYYYLVKEAAIDHECFAGIVNSMGSVTAMDSIVTAAAAGQNLTSSFQGLTVDHADF